MPNACIHCGFLSWPVCLSHHILQRGFSVLSLARLELKQITESKEKKKWVHWAERRRRRWSQVWVSYVLRFWSHLSYLDQYLHLLLLSNTHFSELLLKVTPFPKQAFFFFFFDLIGYWWYEVFFVNTDEKYYKTSSDWIKCKDGSKKFSKTQLNDDFCDCPDGTDEPGFYFFPLPFY